MSDRDPAPPFVPVYKTTPDNAARIARILREFGLHPELLDDPPPYVKGVIREVRVGVPQDEADTARKVLQEGDLIQRRNVDNINRRVRGDLLLATAVALAVSAFAGFLRGWHPEVFGIALVTWFAVFMLISNIGKR